MIEGVYGIQYVSVFDTDICDYIELCHSSNYH